MARELAECRQRGLDWLDRRTHNQQPVRAAVLQQLASDYVTVRGIQLRGRGAQIKRLLRDALAAYSAQDNEADAQLVTDLFFGDPQDAGLRAGQLLDRARVKWGNPDVAWFREKRNAVFREFAEYLVGFGAAPAAPAAPGATDLVPAAEAPVAVYTSPLAERRTRPWSRLEAVLTFAYEDPGGTGKLTIDEHQRVIREQGACWWGWFRALHEVDHSAAIRKQLGNSSCEIGLWARSKGFFYIASCESAAVAEGHDLLPSPDPGLTPSYYNGTIWPAWLKLTAIRQTDAQEVAERFGDLPNTKETVYWNPEPVREALVVPAQGKSILHLADLHFGEHHRWNTCFASRRATMSTEQAITRVLQAHDVDIAAVGVVIICGNFASGEPTRAAYQESLAFIDGLCADLPNVSRKHVVILPGADDFARPGDRARAGQALYRQFHQELYSDDPAMDLTRLRRYEFDDLALNVLPVNSAKQLGIEERDEGLFGQVYDAQLHTMMQDYLRSRETGKRVVNIVAAHHHPVPTIVRLPVTKAGEPGREHRMPGILDARELFTKLAANRVRLFLHGHLHEPEYLRVASDDGWEVVLCSAGTAGAAEWWLRSNYRNNYNNSIALYDIEDAQVSGRFMAFDEDFRSSVPLKRFRIPDPSPRRAG